MRRGDWHKLPLWSSASWLHSSKRTMSLYSRCYSSVLSLYGRPLLTDQQTLVLCTKRAIERVTDTRRLRRHQRRQQQNKQWRQKGVRASLALCGTQRNEKWTVMHFSNLPCPLQDDFIPNESRACRRSEWIHLAEDTAKFEKCVTVHFSVWHIGWGKFKPSNMLWIVALL